MARPTWTGSIAFGLVTIPVKLYTATESHRIAFHELEAGTGQRIRHKRVAERSGREVPWNKIERGFEVGKGRFVMLSDEEMAAAAPAKTRAVEIEQFVDLGEIDPVSWDQTYYVVPDGAAAAKAFVLLRRAMEESHRVAIGRFVMRSKEYLVCVRPFGRILALETMFFPDEVRSTEPLEDDVKAKAAVNPRELAMARQLIDSLSSSWKPEAHQDTFSARVMKLVEKKAKGQEIVVEEPAEEQGQVFDLMTALKQTLAGGKRKPPAATAPRRRSRPSGRKAAARRGRAGARRSPSRA